MDQRLHQIAERLGRDEMLLQLAEECSELSQACLKIVRANKGLTPKTVDEMNNNIKTLMAIPGKRYDTIIVCVITAIASAIIGFMLNSILPV